MQQSIPNALPISRMDLTYAILLKNIAGRGAAQCRPVSSGKLIYKGTGNGRG
jgi:hypothetical protein